MATFRPPTDDLVFWAQPWERGIMRFLKPGPRGRNVFKMKDGSFTEDQPFDYENIDIVYHGGHIHTVSGQEEQDLRDAGYGDYITT